MSYIRQHQTNGYVNGTASNQRLQRFDLAEASDTSADERSRSRPGYTHQQPEQVHGVARLDRGNARRSRDYGASASRSRSRPGARYGGAGGQVEEILRYIEQHWSFMASSTCIPIKVALQLKDPSSLGLADQHANFTEAHTQLQNALKVIVNEHHQGFNSSIGTFHKIQTAIHTSQHRVRTLRAGLMEAKKNLNGTSRPELKALSAGSQGYDGMLQTITNIETLQLVPDRLEAQIREKRYLGAVENLLEAQKLIRRPEMEDIGALGELRVYLSNQEQILTDLLVEELHNHLYLKSPYCEERWKAHMTGRTGDAMEGAGAGEEDRAMYRFLETYDGSAPMQEDTTRNPEADTFYYIQLLVESLNKLARLDVAADRIEERLPVELFKVLERTLSEVEQRHPHPVRSVRQQQIYTNAAGPSAEQKATLEDLLTTLYAKFEAIAESHRVLHDVTASILKRDGITPTDSIHVNRSFRELWKLLQSEMRSLLHDHLASDGDLNGQRSRQREDNASANIFKPQPRDRSRRLFRLADTLVGKSEDLVMEREDLEFILKASVPGLVNANSNTNGVRRPGEGGNSHEDGDRSATGHKLLVEPSVFNMAILLPPSLHFLHRLRSIVPPNSSVVPSNLTAFLDDFLVNVFHPQLDETLLELCSRASGDVEAFQPADPLAWQTVASKPVFKGTVRFVEVVESVCAMLDLLPQDQAFSGLVVEQMRAYYERCYEWSKGLLKRATAGEGDGEGGAGMRLAADLATSGEVSEFVIELLKLPPSSEDAGDVVKEQVVLAEKESELLLMLVKRRELEDADLINDRKALAALCTLQVSMKWLASRCKQLRFISSSRDTVSANTSTKTSQQNGSHQSRQRWTNPDLNLSTSAGSGGGGAPPSTPYLPLDQHSAAQFDAVVLSFAELSTLVLRTLHIDLRLHLLKGIYTALNTTYLLGQPYNDPDPAILALSANLSTYTSTLMTHLLPPQQDFLTLNLHILVNNALTSLLSSIPAMDTFGNARMQLNVLVLQQMLKNIESHPHSDLNKAARFYELGSLGPEAVVKQGPMEGYANEDLKALVRLCWEEERDGGIGSVEHFAARLGGFPARKSSLSRKGGGGSGAGRGRGRGGGGVAGT